MRVSFVLPKLYVNGGILVAVRYARYLHARGHQVSITVPRPQGPGFRSRLRRLLQGRFPWDRGGGEVAGLDLGEIPVTVSRFQRVLEDDVPDADVVIATWWETAEWIDALSTLKGAKVYFIQHHEVFDYLPVDRCRATYRMPMKKIVVAKWLQDLMAREYGDGDAELVSNAVDHEVFSSEPRSKRDVPTVGFLAHAAPFKGVDLTLEAVARLREHFPTLRVLSFGSHAGAAACVEGKGVEFHLSPDPGKISKIYSQCDVWITASRSEGFNLTAMEAMACRVPVVSSRTGWPAEAIRDRENGFLAEVEDVDGLVEGAKWILSLEDRAWRRISESACETVREYSWESSSSAFERCLLKLVEGQNKSSRVECQEMS